MPFTHRTFNFSHNKKTAKSEPDCVQKTNLLSVINVI